LLRAPDRGRGEVLVDAGLEVDVMLVEERPASPQLLVEPAERRAAVAGDVAGGVQPGGEIALALHHRQAHQRLGAGEEHPPVIERVLVSRRRNRRNSAAFSRPWASQPLPGTVPRT
jgi:hypothetical protein